MDETAATPAPSSQPESGSNKNIILIVLFVVIALAVLGGMYFMGQSKTQQPAAAPQPTQEVMVSPTPESAMTQTTPEATPSGVSTTPGKAMAGTEKTFAIEASSFKFNPATITVKKGDTVKIVLTNKGGFHDWVNDEFAAHTKQLSAGQTDTISFVANKAGTFEYYCSVGNHRQMGMVGKLIVQ